MKNSCSSNFVPIFLKEKLTFAFFLKKQVNIDCVTVDGVPCENIPANNGQCKPDLSPLTVLELQYEYRICDDSLNSQEGDGNLFQCVDKADIDLCENVEEVIVTCVGSNGVKYFEGGVGPGDIIPIADPDNSILSAELTCSIDALTQDAVLSCQTVTFDTSGTEDLVLRDTFGSITLASCADNNGNGADCYVDIKYTYTLSNVGSIEMDITEALRTYNNEIPEDLIGLFPSDTNPLQVGDSVSISENKTIDVCTDATYEVEIYVEADPPGDINCNDTDSFKFNVSFERPCDVQVRDIFFHILFGVYWCAYPEISMLVVPISPLFAD